jgi:hypothetical protein
MKNFLTNLSWQACIREQLVEQQKSVEQNKKIIEQNDKIIELLEKIVNK